jgi:hypothetical protein
MNKDRASSAVASIAIEVAPAELIDRITILELKSERLTSESALRNVRTELASLSAARARTIAATPALDALCAELRGVNERLWSLEETVRAMEAEQDFGPKFIESVRAIMHTNDRRAAVKQAINRMLNASFLDEKSFPLPEVGKKL